MSPGQIQAFNVATVLYSMAYFFAPHQRHHGFPFPLIRNFVSEDNPSGFNWACFVLITLAEAAKHVKLQLSHGCSSVMIYGCTLLIQVFYLDNLNFGPMSPFHMDLPRIHYYTQDVIHMMSLADACPDNNSVKHGKMKLRSASDVCYSRGWHDHLKLPPYTDEMYDNQFISISEIFHRGVCLVDTLGTQLNVLADHNISSVPALAQGLIGPFNKIKSDLLQVIHQVGQKAADSIKRTNLILFAKHMPPVDGINTRKRKHTGLFLIKILQCHVNTEIEFVYHYCYFRSRLHRASEYPNTPCQNFTDSSIEI